MLKATYYFGCRDGPGHYLSNNDLSYDLRRNLESLDGKLCPPVALGLYVIATNRLQGLDCVALAWWDQSVDTRGGSNSIVFYPGWTSDRSDALRSFVQKFPKQFARIPKPLRWMIDIRDAKEAKNDSN